METLLASGDLGRSSPHTGPLESIPDYLQPFVVEQDTARYTSVDQAVWRFVLLQLHARLERTAHPSYSRGLAQSGISPEQIPSIEHMNRALAGIGWRAVCVDGFIPPRAFQAFQALGVLPIAAEIRSPDQLPYTPAPDIIHEAAGHAPILIDREYGSFVRAAGEVALRAFSSPADARVDRAVRRLSELKEAAATPPEQLAEAERELELAVAEQGTPSEMTRVSRLYWWTAEYGLVGDVRDYRLFGAGLLSSLGESHFCHGPGVRKLRLSAACTEVGYDITRPQPQLFVADDFEHLHAVLDEVRETLAYRIGGARALRAALDSEDLATFQFGEGMQLIGKLRALHGPGPSSVLELAPGAALAQDGRALGRLSSRQLVPLGPLRDGTDTRALDAGALGQRRAPDGRVTLEYASGARISGVPCRGPFDGTALVLWLAEPRVELHGEALSAGAGPLPVVLANEFVTAGAGSASPDVSPLEGDEGAPPRPHIGARPRVPKLRSAAAPRVALEPLYARAARIRIAGASERGQSVPLALEAMDDELERSAPHEWLLRWNMLECLQRHGAGGHPLAARLRARLAELERHHEGRHPIALGLDYLAGRP